MSDTRFIKGPTAAPASTDAGTYTARPVKSVFMYNNQKVINGNDFKVTRLEGHKDPVDNTPASELQAKNDVGHQALVFTPPIKTSLKGAKPHTFLSNTVTASSYYNPTISGTHDFSTQVPFLAIKKDNPGYVRVKDGTRYSNSLIMSKPQL